MDARRSQSFRKAPTPTASKVKMTKTQSQASVTPSQMSEQTRAAANADKNPLDALSRNTFRRNTERRSGLQDIDEEYVQLLTNPTQNASRYQHAAGQRTSNPNQNQVGAATVAAVVTGAQQNIQPAAQQQQQQATIAQEQFKSAQNMQQQNVAAADLNAMQQQQQSQPNLQQQANFSSASGEPEMCTTCPHCQTLIYLANPSYEPQMNQGHPEGATLGKS